jgi:hypothetical protein
MKKIDLKVLKQAYEGSSKETVVHHN